MADEGNDDLARGIRFGIHAAAQGAKGSGPQVLASPSSDDASEVLRRVQRIEASRRGWDHATRVVKAEEAKTSANELFRSGKLKPALTDYVKAIWLLKQGDPPCPHVLGSDLRGLDSVPRQLGAGTGDAPELDKVGPLRLTCHLNLAQAALKLEKWQIAQAACEWAVRAEPTNVKGHYRLAKAHEGAGELRKATAAVQHLLKVDAANVDGQQLRASLRKQEAKQKGMFGGMFDRAQAAGEGLYTAAEEQRGRDEHSGKPGPGEPGYVPADAAKWMSAQRWGDMSEAQQKSLLDSIHNDDDWDSD